MAVEFFHLNEKYASDIDTKSFETEFKQIASRVKDAKIYFIHNPKIKNLVTTDIDLLLIIAIENKQGNFFYVEKEKNDGIQKCYLFNLIVPIKFENKYNNSNLMVFENYKTNTGIIGRMENGTIFEDNFQDIICYLKNQAGDYLKDIFNNKLQESEKIKDKIYFHPIVWIFNNHRENHCFSKCHIICSSKFGFKEFMEYLKYSQDFFMFRSVDRWSLKEKHKEFELIEKYLINLDDKIKKDSIIGSLTKKKIDQITSEYHKDLRIYEKFIKQENNVFDEEFSLADYSIKTKKLIQLSDRIKAEKGIGNNLIIVSGKAGSGKTTELLLLIKKCYENSMSTRFLTYNRLLTYDVKSILDEYQFLSLKNNKIKTSVRTIHQFIWKIVYKDFRILLIMLNYRIEELKRIQTERVNLLINTLSPILDEKIKDLHKEPIRTISNLLNSLDKETINFYRLFLEKNRIVMKSIFDDNKESGYYLYNLGENKEEFISKLLSYKETCENYLVYSLGKEVFFADYYNILSNLILVLKDPEKFWKDYNIENISDDVWKMVTKNKKFYREEQYDKRNLSHFKTMIKRSLGQIKSTKVLFIDEAQDCEKVERDLFFTIFEKGSIVVSTGGKEQLIRYQEECNWEVDGQGKKHSVIKIEKRNKTFRMKKAIVELCNFIAKKYEIKLDLECVLDDPGEVILDFNFDKDSLIYQFNILNSKGKSNDLTPFESILFLIESGSKNTFCSKKSYENLKELKIDEHNNIHYNERKKSSKNFILSSLLNLENDGFSDNPIWTHKLDQENNQDDLDDNEQNYNQEASPSQNQYRAICYESCRGLEAWSVMCFDIDSFFQRKKEEDMAALHLSDDLFLSEEERRQKYAATWVLMALTRAMDTLYIQVNDINSEFGKILYEYYQQKES